MGESLGSSLPRKAWAGLAFGGWVLFDDPWSEPKAIGSNGGCSLQVKLRHPHPIALALIDPVEELRDGIDLVVVAPVRELQQLRAKLVEPFGAPRQMNVAGLDLGGLGVHARGLIDLGPEWNWVRYALFLAKILD